MFIIYKNQKLCFSIDWLQFSVRLNPQDLTIVCPNGYRMERLPGNNVFRFRYIISSSQGSKILTILSEPYSKVIADNLATVQIANEYLYYDDGIKFAWELTQKINSHVVFNSMGRLDLCCDFEADNRHLNIIRRLNSGAMYVQGKTEGSVFWHYHDYKGNDVKFPHCLSWGAQKSEIKFKLYNKTREQAITTSFDVGEKPYIVNMWRDCDMDITRIWRHELSMSSSGQMRFDGKSLNITDCYDCERMYLIYAGMYDRRFIVRKNEGRRTTEHNNDSIVTLIDLPYKGYNMKWKCSNTQNANRETISVLRKLISQLDSNVCKCNDVVYCSVADTIETLTAQAQLDWYWWRVFGMSCHDFICKQYDEIGFGVHDVKPSLMRDVT